MREFPIEERGEINRSKFGLVAEKNANRIVHGREFRNQKPMDETHGKLFP